MKSSIQKRTNSPVNISDDDDDFNLDPYSDSDKIFDEPVAKKVKADFGDHASILYEMLDASSEEIENAITLDENIDEAALYILNGGNNRSIANESAPNHHACITTEDHIRTMKAKYNYSDQIFVKISRHKKVQSEIHENLLMLYKGEPFGNDENLLKPIVIRFINKELAQAYKKNLRQFCMIYSSKE